MTQIEQIKAEIEKLRDYQISCIKNDYRLTGKPEENIILECNKLLSFINSLQAEPVSEDLNEVITKVKTKISMCNGFNKKNREEVFALLDTIKMPKKEVSEDLEEEIDKYVNTPENQGNPELKEELFECALHFANWQKGRMLKDAVDANVSFGQPVLLTKPIPTNIAKDGDKVKLIVIKED